MTGLAPNGTYVVSESKAPTGYIKDETPKNIVVRTGVANSLIFDNDPATTLIIHKYIEGTENEPLSGVAFKVVDGSGAAVGPDDGTYYTDKAGEIVLDGLEPGTTITAREIKTVDEFVLDGTPQDILIKAGEVQNLTFWNKRAGTLLIEKLDSVTKKPLAGAQFKVVYADGRVVDTEGGKLSSNGIYTTNSNGQIKITGLVGTVVVTEEKAPDGYVMDANGKSQTVIVNPQDTQTLRFYNEPLCSLTLTKLDSVSGKPVPKTEFAVRDGSGTLLGRYTTGSDGTVTVTGIVPGTTVVVTETKVPRGTPPKFLSMPGTRKKGPRKCPGQIRGPQGALRRHMICSSAQLSTTRIPISSRAATGYRAMLFASNFGQIRFSGSIRRSLPPSGPSFRTMCSPPRIVFARWTGSFWQDLGAIVGGLHMI